MISRLIAALTAAIVLLTGAFGATAQESKAVPRIGLLGSASLERDRGPAAAFHQGLRELGYVRGRNIVIEERWAAGDFEKLPELIAELLRLRIDVLVVAGAPAAHAARTATRTIPIVMTNAADPVGTGLVASLARPGGNITGRSDFNTGVVAKRLQLLKETLPAASRVAVLSNPANPTNPPQLQLSRAAAPAAGVALLSLEAQRLEDIDRVFGALAKERVDALVVFGDPFLGTRQKRILELATKRRLPTFGSQPSWTEHGALMSYGTNFNELFHRAAAYVDKILKGARPADLPIEQPSAFELTINLKVAQAFGITVPRPVLVRADRVIE